MNWLVYMFGEMETHTVSVERIAEYIEQESEVFGNLVSYFSWSSNHTLFIYCIFTHGKSIIPFMFKCVKIFGPYFYITNDFQNFSR